MAMGMRSLSAVIAALFALGMPYTAAAAHPARTQNVIVLRPGAMSPAGAAVLIDSSLVVTAAHVVHGMILQVVCGDTPIPAVVRGVSDELDLALLETVTPCLAAGAALSPLADDDPEVGDEIYTLGCPGGHCGRLGHGIVTDYDDGLAIVDARTWYGSSGGGMFTPDGKLLGICSQIAVMAESSKAPPPAPKEHYSQVWGAYVPVNTIRKFILATILETTPHVE